MGAGSILGTQLSVASHIMESIGGGRTGLLLVRLLKVNALPAYNNFWSPRSLFLPPVTFRLHGILQRDARHVLLLTDIRLVSQQW